MASRRTLLIGILVAARTAITQQDSPIRAIVTCALALPLVMASCDTADRGASGEPSMGRCSSSSLITPAVARRSATVPVSDDPGRRVPTGGEGWGPIETVADAAPYLAEPDLALDIHGEPAVVWYDSQDEAVRFRASQGGQWGPVELVGRGGPARLGIGRDGTVTVVWQRRRSGYGPEVVTKDRHPDGSWSKLRILSRIVEDDGTNTGAWLSALEMDRSGTALAAWSWGSVDGGPDPRAQVAYRPAGGRWTEFKDLDTAPSRVHDILLTPGGNATAAMWATTAGGTASRTYHDGHWGPFRTITADPVELLALTNGSGDHPYVVWTRPRRDGARVKVARLVDGSWCLLANFRASTYRKLRSLDAHGGRNGTLTVAWLDRDRVVKSTRLTPGGSREPIATLSDTGVGYTISLAGNRDGDVIATWTRRREGERFPSLLDTALRGRDASTWSNAALLSGLSEDVTPYEEQPAVVDEAGRAAVVWESETDGMVRVRRTN
jgi:hypothetical protein